MVHPYLSGNFAPVHGEYISHPCPIVQGSIPRELLGGQYIRNGGNPINPPETGRHYHWFDGDGMLHGVLFPEENDEDQRPRYTNRHLVTPILSLSLLLLRTPLPSISLLISPLSSLHHIIVAIFHTFLLALEARVGTLSVANTNVLWWGSHLGTDSDPSSSEGKVRDNRLLALCESGPPLEVRLPGMETVTWDRLKEGGPGADDEAQSLRERRRGWGWRRWGLGRIQDDWMTAHPRVDPSTGDLIFYQCQMFEKPYLRYSVIDKNGTHKVWKQGIDVGRAKMMHDFGVSQTHSILLNLPLTLSPLNLLTLPPSPLIHFDRSLPSDFIVFPRHLTSPPIIFRDPEPSMIFHTANTWDEETQEGRSVNMLACRFNSAKLVYAAGAVPIPLHEAAMGKDDVVRLHYYQFLLPSTSPSPSPPPNEGYTAKDMEIRPINHSFPLSPIPFEFPSTHPAYATSSARYIYGCTMREGGFDERLGGAAKVDCLVKFDVGGLIERGRKRGEGKGGAVDERSVLEILAHQEGGKQGEVEVFALQEGWYAQEGRFVPREGDGLDEDDGYILTYVYDEGYLLPDGSASMNEGTGSELWIIDAKKMGLRMEAVVCRIKLPQRVPYGLHGTYVPASQFARQRLLPIPLPPQPSLLDKLQASRLAHLVDVVFSRPTEREKSKGERIAFAIMFPLGWFMLALAASEAMRTWWEYQLAEEVRLGGVSKEGQVWSMFPWPQAVSGASLLLSLYFMPKG